MNPLFPRLIRAAIKSFDLCLSGKTVLTEAATGNYSVTPIIAALSGAEVFAFSRSSRFGTVDEVRWQTIELQNAIDPAMQIQVIDSLDDVPLDRVEILTNTGFLRPIDSVLINRLPISCVIPLMWEVWEARPNELDLEACLKRGIKVYGTNEQDSRLRTMEYLGFIILERLLAFKRTPFSTRVLLLGCGKFGTPVQELLIRNGYKCHFVSQCEPNVMDDYDALVLLEHNNPIELVGSSNALIPASNLRSDQLVIHICGQADFSELTCTRFPDQPAPFGYMSLTTDYADPKAVIDLHTAGLKVAEGMIKANHLGLSGIEYKRYMETKYPAQAFADDRYW